MSNLLGIWVLLSCGRSGPFGKGDEPYHSWVCFLLLPLQRIASKPYTGLLLCLVLTSFPQLLANLHHDLLLHPPGIYLGPVILSTENTSLGMRYLRCISPPNFLESLAGDPLFWFPTPQKSNYPICFFIFCLIYNCISHYHFVGCGAISSSFILPLLCFSCTKLITLYLQAQF